MKQISGIFQRESTDIVSKGGEEREGRGDILRKWFVTVILREPLRLAVCMKVDSLEVIVYLANADKFLHYNSELISFFFQNLIFCL